MYLVDDGNVIFSVAFDDYLFDYYNIQINEINK